MEFSHFPVMANQAVNLMAVKQNGIYIDSTLGGGGHTKLILSLIGETGRVIGIDRDGDAINHVRTSLDDFRLSLWHGNFSRIAEAAEDFGVRNVDGILFDLGVSSYQLDNPKRGFSYVTDSPLDMRMDTAQTLTASDIVNGYPKEELTRIFSEYGEEPFSRKITEAIIREREVSPITATRRLAEIISEVCPPYYRKSGHPAKRCFQALRIEVNGELDELKKALNAAVELLSPGGRIVVISFHSLEDRTVKTFFRQQENPCECPKDLPRCVCGKKATLKIITKKPVIPGEDENTKNPRSHSSKLRAAEKL